MKTLVDFLQTNEIEKSQIFLHLKCSNAEALKLQYLAKKYMQGQDDVLVLDLLQDLHEGDNYEYLDHLQEVKILLELGWLHQQSFTPMKISEVTPLELLNTAVGLSPSFLKLLQDGTLESDLPEIKPYADHLEYLQDQFFRIELYQKMSSIRQNVHEHSLGIDRIQHKLKLLEQRIEERVKQTAENLVLDKFFKQKKLNNYEQVIFIALLREEYSATDATLREMNTLIDLISFDEYERIKNRSLLEEGSNLVGDGIIDYEEMLNPFGGISRAFYIVDEVLQGIIHPQKSKKVTRLKLNALVQEQDIFELVDSETSLEDVILNKKTEETLENLMRQVDKEVINRLVKWGVKDKKSGIDARIIFYGAAGTGKTMTAYSLAKSLKRQVLAFDCSKILSMYVGESEKNVRKIFDTFYDLCEKTKTEPILLLNEADQFLSSRSSGISSSADQMHNQMQNIFLEQIENFRGMLIATTNLLENIDKAFSRRFNYKIEFKRPDEAQRVELWKKMLPLDAPYEKDFDPLPLSKYALTGGQINLIVKNTAYKVAVRENPLFTQEDFIQEIQREKDANFDSEKSVGFINK
ncbi:MAG: ATP-binding protein [Epsilonproteobacteria bacterium]|nr:ATP-binding protein [Campylobacterota bacterium]OIO14994.1 MAG: AAA family ATPase [Helicobacteraceae bacterium CG1_02_36_14]PIP10548.1 MAG: AAA family ATPase [Sulfurimonas sp. CG23_combo_of_CG06-09_8_20_14_all_36_33]PIS26998.1 MAG: AAA family ATPase [Sulfurimonas sp. CG08_land_8_20_14_0_20_36_33]PIU35892.1 MAG: AAA family ATPase [Sulfurimonas sp. CG07_land_8_20_14_0_80_36_56]PIV03469.1 MAG: AAA family ATPase [Sulfurimonas sp. CG03_land_8_20_14_0_80_36_25]PIV35415.1 MAG: AAA family ATPase [